jgi:predicted Zn-dependent protease
MKDLSLSILFGLFCMQVFAQNKPATIKEYKKTFTTYPFSDPNPIPNPSTMIYPYFRFDGFTDKPIQKEWKVIELENDFIKLMILPEIGGKIWSATEKSTGKDFVYNNHVVKFRDIAMRGPWTSGGVEANYGIVGHTPNCATPVDYMIVNKPDGSTSCIIGALDLLTRTTWHMEINLPKDKAYFTTHSIWFNSTPFDEPYYTWMNTGLKASDDLEFIYPGNKYLGHEGEYANWPINKQTGKNISFYKENNFGGPKSYHVFGKYTDFFGAYYHDEDFGMARYSTHDDKPGKKIWIWGLSDQGMIWKDLLTDTDGQYVEVQSGRLFNQSAAKSIFTPFKHRYFAPAQTDEWTEYWFPVKKTKGFVKANEYGGLNIRYEDNWLKVYFSPLQKIDEPLEILDGGKLIYSKAIHATPLKTFSDSIKIKGLNENALEIRLGKSKIEYFADSSAENLSRPVDIASNFDNNSVYGLYLQGKNNISFKDYKKAEELLSACLQKDSNYLPALCDMAALLLRKFRYEDALSLTKRALSIDTYNPAANYYYGLTNLRLKNTVDAKDGLDIAALSPQYRTAAYNQLAKIHFRENNFAKAIDYAQKSLTTNQHNLDGLQLLAVIYRYQKKQQLFTATCEKIKAIDPLNHFVRFEKYAFGKTDLAKNDFLGTITNELPSQTFLEMGIWYHEILCDKEAIELFSLSPLTEEISYWKAFLQKKPIDLNGIKTSTNFPFREETSSILSNLIMNNPQWQLKYHLALIEWNRDNIELAKKLFLKCADEPNDANFYMAKAALFNDDLQEANAYIIKAIHLDNKEWRYKKLLTENYLSKKKYDTALWTARKNYRLYPQNYILGMLYAKILLLTANYASADSLLSVIQILPFEGATEGRQLYHEAKLMQAINEMQNKNFTQALAFVQQAKLWPKNLGVGKPYDEDIDDRLENWFSYYCYTQLKETDKATASLNKIVQFIPKTENTIQNYLPANHLVTAWALETIHNRQAANDWLDKQINEMPENKIFKWCKSTFNENNKLPNDNLINESSEAWILNQFLKLK